MIYILLTVTTLLAFWRVTRCDFINFDDQVYVTENTHIMKGVTLEAIRWAFTNNTYARFWHPLTMISHMLDVQFFGLNPRGHHLMNLLFHVANTLLLFFVLHRMTKALWKSAFVAALFALHPLNVESVAWVAERKNVLSTFFWMLTMVAYASYAERRRRKTYFVTLALFIMGLMAKPMLVTLPFTMLLLDYWPLQRLATENRTGRGYPVFDIKASRTRPKTSPHTTVNEGSYAQHNYEWASVRTLLIEKIPFFALIFPFSLLAYISQGDAVNTSLSWNAKASNALVSYVIYIVKIIWPTNLAIFYPHPGLCPFWQTAGAGLLLVAITGAVVLAAKRYPYLIVGWLWFTGTLVPVIGIVQITSFARADRFAYIPLIGLFIMAAWGVPELLKKWQYRKETLVVSSALVISSLCIVTWTQVGYWRNSIALFDHALQTTSRNYRVHQLRGETYRDLGRFRLAIMDYDKAIAIHPDAGSYINRGLSYYQLGNRNKALKDFDEAIRINPHCADAYNDLGVVHYLLGKYNEAIKDYDKAIEINPKNAEYYNSRGYVHATLGSYKDAINDYDKAIELRPELFTAYFNRGNSYFRLSDYRQAASDYNKAIGINPKYGDAYNNNRALAYSELGNNKQAVEDMKTAAKLGSEEAKNLLKSQGISW